MTANDISRTPNPNTKVESESAICAIYKISNTAKLIKVLEGIACVFVIKPLIK